MLRFQEIPVSEASEDILRLTTDLINRANAAFDRVFPGDRLRADSIVIECPNGLLILGFLDDAPVATLTLTGDKVNLFAVDRSVGGKGLGELMLNRAQEIASSNGFESLWLEVVDAGKLVDYYLRIGFTEDSRAVMPVGTWRSPEPFELVTMSRQIQDPSLSDRACL